MKRGTIFIVSLVYLSVILVLGFIFFLKATRPSLLAFLPDTFGPVPLGVPWFGALGAVVISLSGVFDHEKDWDEDFWPWHLARPLIGIALGVVSMLIFKAGVLAVGSKPNLDTSVPPNLLYYVIAFLVGYREQTFRELIKRLVDIVLAPGGSSGRVPTIHAVNPNQALHNAATPGVVVSGSGFTGTQSVKFGSAVAQFKFDSDGQITVTTPVVPAAGPTSLTVTSKSGSASLPFTFN